MKSFMSSFPVSRHVRLRGNGVVGQGGFCLFQRVDNRCTEFRYAHAFFAGSHNDIRMSRRTLADFGRHFVACLSKIACLHLVRLGYGDPVADGGLIQHFHDVAVDILDAMTGINEKERAFKHLPPAQIIIHQKAPFTDHLLRRLRKTVPRHIDKTEQERIANVEEIQLLRTSRRVRGACQRSEEHTSELQSLMRISYAVFCLKKKNYKSESYTETTHQSHT